VYLVFYSPEGWVIFDHPYNGGDARFTNMEPHRCGWCDAPPARWKPAAGKGQMPGSMIMRAGVPAVALAAN